MTINAIEKYEYKGVEITLMNTGKFYLKSPINGTQRIFNDMERATCYIDNAESLEQKAEALSRNPL